MAKAGRRSDILDAQFITGFNDIPNKDLNVFSLFPVGTRAKDVDYDIIMYDTYDYIDKLIGFKLSDIFYASFYKYYEANGDNRALKLVKYGTDNDRYIWMLRYGLTFEDIDVLDPHIKSIDSTEIVFKESIMDIPDGLKQPVARFIH